MNKEEMYKHIINAIPSPIVFVDCEHIIRFLNKSAEFFYYTSRGYSNLIGKSIFECHSEPKSKETILKYVEKLKNHSPEIFLYVRPGTDIRLYLTPVRDDSGNFIGYFERFEGNFKI